MSKFVEKILTEGLIVEAKNIGILYHYTSIRHTINILKTDIIYSSTRITKDNKKIKTFSTTRNKNFHKGIDRLNDGINGISVRISLDGNKISNNYKIVPYNFFFRYNKTSTTRPIETESEEEIIINKDGIKNYIINITIFKKTTDLNEDIQKAIDEIETNNIKYNIEEI